MREKLKGGQVYGKLTVIGFGSGYISPKGQRKITYIVRCSCGNTKETTRQSLTTAKYPSCGCDLSEIKRKIATDKFGERCPRTYNSWRGMIERCTDPKNSHYLIYGGRGITVCDRWLESFENFLEDMGERPKGLTLDRINVDGNYCKDNCQWATTHEQAFNIGVKSNNTSGRTGVMYNKKNNSWIATIGVLGVKTYLGSFPSFEAACNAREGAEIKFYGRSKL